jgi:hypothetical protein
VRRAPAAALLALAVVIGGAGTARAQRFSGVIPDRGPAGGLPAASGQSLELPYEGGKVLHSNRTHLIFWQPPGFTFDPGYKTLIETFLRNVAAASHNAASVYGLTGQYRDRSGPARYISTFGGAVTATDPLPAQRCQEPAPPAGPPGWSACVTDEQLQHEIEHAIRENALPTGWGNVYFLVTPDGLGDCAYAGSNSCALGGDVNGYCGYHSETDDGLVLYAVIPYNAVAGHCQSENPRPNDSTADPAISTISHEQSELITDPLGNGWIDPSSGEEVGDLCLTSFGNPIGGSGNSAWNEVINGGHYFLQEEWSNYNGGCEPHARLDSVSFRAGLSSSQGLSVWFSPHAVDPQGRIVIYRWFFGDRRTSTGRRALHRYRRPGRYRVVLRTTDSWGNWAYYAATLAISRNGGRSVLATNAG